MGTIKRTTRKAAGKAKEAVAEVLGAIIAGRY